MKEASNLQQLTLNTKDDIENSKPTETETTEKPVVTKILEPPPVP